MASRRSLGETARAEEVRSGLQAAALLEEVLASWRQVLAVLDRAGRRDGFRKECASLNRAFTPVNNPLNRRAIS